MKTQLLIFYFACAFATLNLEAQSINGEYRDHFGAYLNLKADSTFKYTFNSHRVHVWSAGKWHINNKFIALKVITIYDTLHYNGKDSLILSADDVPNKFTANQFALSNQKDKVYPDTFFVEKNKLIPVVDGKIIRKKRRSITTNQKLTQAFIRK